jgi:hypothetical protein
MPLKTQQEDTLLKIFESIASNDLLKKSRRTWARSGTKESAVCSENIDYAPTKIHLRGSDKSQRLRNFQNKHQERTKILS